MPGLKMLNGFLVAACLAAAATASALSVTDSAGRTVEVPDRVETVFAAGPPAAILIYVLRPGTLSGWPRALRPSEAALLPPAYHELPETGRLTGRGGDANLERVLTIRPDLIVDFGSVHGTYMDLAERVQRQTGFPYLLIDGRLDATPGALRLVGEVLGVPERGELLARDVERTFARLDAILADIPPTARPRVYLARGPDGLETGVAGSINTEIIERAGGSNVIDPRDGRRGLVRVSMEQVLVADPEVIVTWDNDFYRRVFHDPLWASLSAVRHGRVYLAPSVPFGWVDRPPSINRIIGLRWMAALLHPEAWEVDLRSEVREFYALYYHSALSDEDLDRLLERAQGKSAP